MKNKSVKNFKSILLFGGLAVFLLSPEIVKAQTYTLPDILDSIAARNPGLQQFALKTKSSLAMSGAAKAWPDPEAGIGLSEFPYGSISKFNNGMVPRKMLALQIGQWFPNFSRQNAESNYYQSFAAQNNDQLQTMKNMLFSQAKAAYYNSVIAEKKQAIIDEQIKQLELLIKIAEGRLAYSKADLPTIYNARSRVSDWQSKLIQLQSTVEQGMTIINTLMNQPPDNPLQIDTSLNTETNELNILQADSAYVLAHRSDIQLTGHEIHSMQWSREATLSLGKPTFGITWDNMRMAGNAYMYNLMAMVSIPIAPWSSKGYKSESKAINYQIQSMQKMKENQMLEAVGNIRKDWLALEAQRQDVKIFLTEVIPAYQKTWQANLNAFSENTGDIYQTLMAWNDLTMKRMEYLDKLGEMLQMKVMLETEMQVN